MTDTTCPQPEKAMAIARDVLERLDQRNHGRGSYLRNNNDQFNFDDWVKILAAKDLGEVLDVVEKECRVCMLGTCLLSKARLYDEVSLVNIRARYSRTISLSEGQTYEQLVDIFGRFELCKLESFFEQRPRNVYMETDYSPFRHDQQEELDRCGTAGECFPDAKERVRAAMNNFIAHNGCLTVDGEPPRLVEVTTFYSCP